MGGVERHPSLSERFDPAVRIVEYDPAWPGQAAAELARIADALGPVAVRLEHVGSTAVPGLAAKPIIDLLVSVADIDDEGAYVGPLEGLGYLHAPSPGFHFFGRPHARPRTHHVQVCAAGSEFEHRHLAVRDHLRARPDEAADYAALKREVAERHPQDRIAYIEGKDGYVRALEARALAESRLAPAPRD
jgi:GrpB-like predicted nucleotidyltransferase (UPF0157 family)